MRSENDRSKNLVFTDIAHALIDLFQRNNSNFQKVAKMKIAHGKKTELASHLHFCDAIFILSWYLYFDNCVFQVLADASVDAMDVYELRLDIWSASLDNELNNPSEVRLLCK